MGFPAQKPHPPPMRKLLLFPSLFLLASLLPAAMRGTLICPVALACLLLHAALLLVSQAGVGWAVEEADPPGASLVLGCLAASGASSSPA